MHEKLSHRRGESGGIMAIDDKIDEEEFIHMVETMTLAELSPAQVRTLHSIFLEHSTEIEHMPTPSMPPAVATASSDGGSPMPSLYLDGGAGAAATKTDHVKSAAGTGSTGRGNRMVKSRGLNEHSLGKLLEALGHPDEAVELHCIMAEWDVQNRGFLDFEALLSIVATYVRIEELDQRMEEDYLTLCGYSIEEQKAMLPVEKEAAEVSPELLHEAVLRYGSRRMADLYDGRRQGDGV
jgi:hypothetical protein